MKTVIRQAPLFAGVILTLIVFAFLDQIPDNPCELKDQRILQGQILNTAGSQSFHAKGEAFLLRGMVPRSARLPIVSFDVERTLASTGIFDLRSATDSSPPVSAS